MDRDIKNRILVADPDLRHQATLIGTLKDRYHVATATSAAEFRKKLAKQQIDLILSQTDFPDQDGFSLCRQLQQDERSRSIPVIFVTARKTAADEEKAFREGAADYITTPYNALTLLARIENQLTRAHALAELTRLHQLALDANPNTGLPGNTSIRQELHRIVETGGPYCVIYADLDHFKIYNDTYGFARGDEVIIFTANVIRVALHQANCGDAFLGHIGGDDFVLIVPSDKWRKVSDEIIRRIDHGIADFYHPQDVARGFVEAPNRTGIVERHPLVCLSMGGADLVQRQVGNALEIIDICTETKGAAKRMPGSTILICQRQEPAGGES